MTEIKSPEEIQAYIDVNTAFGSYDKFADDRTKREAQVAAFIADTVYAPSFEYPRLKQLYDHDGMEEPVIYGKKQAAYEAMWELDAHRESGIDEPEIMDSYAGMHEKKLKIMLLVEAAEQMRTAGSSQARQTAREQFTQLNTELYGEMDEAAFAGVMAQQRLLVADFSPVGKVATAVHRDLLDYFERKHFSGQDVELLDAEAVGIIRPQLMKRYESALGHFPETADDVMYTTEEAITLMQAALDAGGLGTAGWRVELDPKATVPNTNVAKRRIFLSPGKSRNANQIKRLYLHEAEVHARRGQHGIESGVSLLARGTADCADAEEGLGIVLESIHAGSFDSPAFARARDRYIVAGLALGTDGTPRDARQTYELTWRMLALRRARGGEIAPDDLQAAKHEAMLHIENAFRGTDLVQRGVIYAKLKTYYEGLIKNVRFLKDNLDTIPEALDMAMQGKFDHTNPTEVALVRRLLDQNN